MPICEQQRQTFHEIAPISGHTRTPLILQRDPTRMAWLFTSPCVTLPLLQPNRLEGEANFEVKTAIQSSRYLKQGSSSQEVRVVMRDGNSDSSPGGRWIKLGSAGTILDLRRAMFRLGGHVDVSNISNYGRHQFEYGGDCSPRVLEYIRCH